MLRDQGSQTVDTKILTGMNLSVLNQDSIMAFRMNHRNTQLNHPWSNLTDEELLIRIGAAAISDTDGKAHPTGAGLLMFGNEYEIVREYPNYFLDFREMVNDITEWTDRIWVYIRRLERQCFRFLPPHSHPHSPGSQGSIPS